MRRSIILFILISLIIALSAASTMAQSGQSMVGIGVNVTCGSITVTLDSDYGRPIIAQVYAGTSGNTNWNLVDDIGNFATAGANGSGTRTYYFVIQPANTRVYYSVRVYDDTNNGLVATSDGNRDCDGEANNQSSSATTATSSSTTTASFLASCDTSGGILVQPIGGASFSINATQIAQGTAMAIANNQNFTISTTGNITVTGTPANAVNISASDGYNITIPASSCAQTVTVTTTTTYSSASAQAAQLSCSSVPADAVSTHVVNPGENLFRIGLRYGVHFTILASYNGIPDPTRIFVGQCIGIPPSS